MVIFTSLLGLSCILSSLYKLFVVEKAYKEDPSYGLENNKKSVR